MPRSSAKVNFVAQAPWRWTVDALMNEFRSGKAVGCFVCLGATPWVLQYSQLASRQSGSITVPPGLMGPASPAGPTGAGSVVPAPLPWSMPTPSPSQAPSHSPSGGRRGVPRIPYHLLSTTGFCTTPFGGVPGGPGAARRLPRASRRCWGLGQSGGTLVGPAVGDSGPVESASRCLRCWRVCARCRRNNSNLQMIARSGSKLTLVFDLLMLLVAYKRRAGVIRACQCPSTSQDGSSNPEATSDLQGG